MIVTALSDGLLSKSEASFFHRNFYNAPYFYHLPKVHKSLDNPPRCPIVVSIESITTSYSLYIDYFLQPLAQALPSYIQDGIHLLGLLCLYTWELTYLWVSLDVCSLYRSIPHEVGLQAVLHFLSEDSDINSRQSQFILAAIRLLI